MRHRPGHSPPANPFRRPTMNRSRSVGRSAAILIASASFSFCASGCSLSTRTIDVAKLGPANQILVYEGGRPIIDRPIAADSAEGLAIMSWLRSHADGWQPTYSTYVPNRYVRGGDFTLNFGGGSCVLNYRSNEKGGWAQVIRPIGEDDPVPAVFAAAQPLK